MFLFYKKLLFSFTYQDAIEKASREEYINALSILNKAPFKNIFFLYYLLAAFLYERIGKFDESLLHYDKAKYLIQQNEKLNEDEKNYLYKYINNGYIYIYNSRENFQEAKEIEKQNSKLVYNIEHINKTLRKDFVLIN